MDEMPEIEPRPYDSLEDQVIVFTSVRKIQNT